MYNITNLALSQAKLTKKDFDIITNTKIDVVLNRITEKIQLRNSILPYVKKAILNQKNGKTETENNEIFNRLKECGKQLWIEEDTGRIGLANFCKNRLCPVCNYRKSTKQWGKIYNIVDKHNGNYNYMLITLTVRNCNKEDLKSTIDDILSSLHRITNRKKWKRAIKGYVRGLEITYNSDLDSFHPHIHMLCAVDKDYLYNADKYITAQELTQDWKESAKLDYRPSTDIRMVDDNKKAVAEVAKYSLKMADILQKGTINSKRAKAVETLYNAIQNRRLNAMAGCFRIKNIKSLDDIDLNDILENFTNKRETLKQIKAYENNEYAEYIENLKPFIYSEVTQNFDNHEKVKIQGGNNESIFNKKRRRF